RSGLARPRGRPFARNTGQPGAGCRGADARDPRPRRRRDALAEAATGGERVERQRGVGNRDVLEKGLASLEGAPDRVDGRSVRVLLMSRERTERVGDVTRKVFAESRRDLGRLLVATENEQRE